ncbi:MAG TPA: helix-turn-helix domain-containing protein [Chloroflexota bacterium]|nr:helix-turn-helix domain-containing protein [Chloroflexota bacterium]
MGADTDVRALATGILGPLVAYDREHGGDLVKTLRVYFLCNGNASRAAKALFLHRNGMLYRLSRVEDLLGVAVSDGEARLALEVAVRILAE